MLTSLREPRASVVERLRGLTTFPVQVKQDRVESFQGLRASGFRFWKQSDRLIEFAFWGSGLSFQFRVSGLSFLLEGSSEMVSGVGDDVCRKVRCQGVLRLHETRTYRGKLHLKRYKLYCRMSSCV